ncbi:MAG: hypothetical protein EXS47_00470 [Candidatus Zambryskibacteria bacterium]|nr:hypothetical protein [Candidatus Zambryskibacteria bacterium]
MDLVRVILFTTSGGDTKDTKASLRQARFTDGLDYKVVASETQAEELIVPGRFQLLVTGLIFGNHRKSQEFAERMKQKNSSLKTASFISLPVANPAYDILVTRSPGVRNCSTALVPLMHKFLEEVRANL